MSNLLKKLPTENGNFTGETLKSNDEVKISFLPEMDNSNCSEDDGEYMGDDKWMMENELQFPWEMEKSSYEFEISEEEE